MRKRLFAISLMLTMLCFRNVTVWAEQAENVISQDVSLEYYENQILSEETKDEENISVDNEGDDTIVLHQTAIELEIGEIDTKSIYVEGSHSPEYWNDIAYQSSDESVAILLRSGLETSSTTIKAVSPGTCDVTAYSISNPENKATCHVTVYDQMQSVNILQEEVSLSLDETIQLSTSVSPATANPEIIWLSSKPAVASVDETGNVTAHADNASCQIFAYSKSLQKYDVCTIKIGNRNIPPATITDGYIVKPTVNNSLTWSIDENGHLEVSGTGNLDEDQPTWASYGCYIKTATINASGMTNLDYWFFWCENLTQIDVRNLDTSEVTSMTDMFNGCSSLESLDLSSFHTEKVTDVDSIFRNCVNLKQLNLSGWYIGWSVLDNPMFDGCYSLESINLSNAFVKYDSEYADDPWEIIGLICVNTFDMENDLGYTEHIKYSPVKRIDLSGAEFKGYKSLSFCDRWMEEINLSNLKATSLTSMSCMFQDCTALKEVTLDGITCGKLTDMSGMFGNCINIKTINLGISNTTKVKDVTAMFSCCHRLESIDMSVFATSRFSGMSNIFENCFHLTKIDLGMLDFGRVEYAEYPSFQNCMNLKEVVLPSIPLIQNDIFLERAYISFPQVNGFCWINPDGFRCIEATSAGKYVARETDAGEQIVAGGTDGALNWIIDASGLLEVNGNGKTEYAGSSPYWCNYESKIKSAKVQVSGLTSMYSFFYGLENMEEVDLSGSDTSQVTDMSRMFWDCKTLSAIDLSGMDTSNVTKMNYMFDDCNNLSTINLSSMNTSKVTDMSNMFAGCKKLKTINVSSFDTSNVKDMGAMFMGCESLESIDLSNFKTSNVTQIDGIFSNCFALKELDLSKLDFSNLITNYETIDIATFSELVYDEVGGYFFYRTLSGNINKVILPSKLPDAKYKLLLPSYEKEYYWKNTTTGKVASNYIQGKYYAEEGGVYIKKKGDPEADTSNGASASGNQNSSNTNTNGLNYEKIGVKLEANQLSTKFGSIPNGSTFTVTSDNPDNPSVSFDGVNNENADEIVIPKSIVYNGITYKVTTVSPKLFTSKKDNASFKVTDNHIDNLTVEYKAPTNKKKAKISIPAYTTYKGIKFKVTGVAAKAFKKNKNLTQVKIGDSITSIGDSCFEGCTKLKSVTIGKGLRTIGKNAFKNCKKLSQITLKSTKLSKLNSSCLKGINAKCKISVPKKMYKKYTKLFKGKIGKNVILKKI